MKKTLVYDWPTRLFHWLFAASFVVAFSIAKWVDDGSPTYSYHMLTGLLAGSLVGLRIIWGIVGSRYARFSSFQLSPRALGGYFRGLLTGRGARELGHNPASSWIALIMMALSVGLATTGFLMTSGGDKETLEDVHELLAHAFLVSAILHVAGVLFHAWRHRDAIGLSMLHGRKLPVPGQEGIAHPYRLAGAAFVIAVAGIVFYLNQNYDGGTQTLRVFGTSLQLGEGEAGEGREATDGSMTENHDEHEH